MALAPKPCPRMARVICQTPDDQANKASLEWNEGGSSQCHHSSFSEDYIIPEFFQMNVFAVLLSFLFLVVSPVRAVSVNDAFEKDWIQFNPCPPTRHILLDHQTVLELSEKNILYYRDIKSSKVQNYIDLSIHNCDDFAIGASTIAAFSKESSSISFFEKTTGIFINSISLNLPPIQVQAYKDVGWTILQSCGPAHELVTWDGRTLHGLGKYHARSFSQYSTTNDTFIFIDSSAHQLIFSEDQEMGSTSLTISSVDYNKTFKELFPFEAVDEFESPNNNRHLSYLLENIAVTYRMTQLTIYKNFDGEAKTLYQETFDDIVDVKVSNATIAVLTYLKAYLLDLCKFLETNSESSIELKVVEIHPYLKLIVFSSGHFLSLNGDKSGSQVYVHDFDIASESSTVLNLPLALFSATGGSILVNVPPLLSKIEEIHHLVEESHSLSILLCWILRTKTHLFQFGQLLSRVIVRKNNASSSEEDVFGFNKVLVQVDDVRSLVMAKSSQSGQSLWTHDFLKIGHINDVTVLGSDVYVIFEFSVEILDLCTGDTLSSRVFEKPIERIVILENNAEDETIASEALAVKSGDHLEFFAGEQKVSSSQSYLYLESNTLQCYKVDGTKLRPTWSWNKRNETLLAVAKNSDSMTAAGGIARYDRSVLYKYLNPNLVSLASEENGTVRLTILDGISGIIFHSQEHRGESIDPASILITQKDNWVVYSMFVLSPVSEQRIVVIDLFQDSKVFTRTSFHPSNVTASSKTFIYPERILALASTNTKHGVTVKSIIALTESGSLVEIPKYFLSSRRIDGRHMTIDDQMDGFRMLPYEPVIQHNPFSILNHKNKLQISSKRQSILVLPTELESTSVVCFVNEFNDFCTIVQPSSSYDILKSDFDKTNLVLTIMALFVGCVLSKPLVASKKLNMKWVD